MTSVVSLISKRAEIQANLRRHGVETKEGIALIRGVIEPFRKKEQRLPLGIELDVMGLSDLVRHYGSVDRALTSIGYTEGQVKATVRLKRASDFRAKSAEEIARYGHDLHAPTGFWKSREADNEAMRRIQAYHDKNGYLPVTHSEFDELGLRFYSVAQFGGISSETILRLLNKLGFQIEPTEASTLIEKRKKLKSGTRTGNGAIKHPLPGTLDGDIANYPDFSESHIRFLHQAHGPKATILLKAMRRDQKTRSDDPFSIRTDFRFSPPD